MYFFVDASIRFIDWCPQETDLTVVIINNDEVKLEHHFLRHIKTLKYIHLPKTTCITSWIEGFLAGQTYLIQPLAALAFLCKDLPQSDQVHVLLTTSSYKYIPENLRICEPPEDPKHDRAAASILPVQSWCDIDSETD